MRRFALLMLFAVPCLGLASCKHTALFQPPTAPEITSKVNDPLLADGWLTVYHKILTSGLCSDNSKPTSSGKCPGDVDYEDDIRSLRNQYIDAIRLKIDESYGNFRSNVYSGNALFGVASDLSVIGLTGAGTVVGDTGLKSILSVAAGGVTGGASSYQKQVLNQQNALAIVAAMDAARATQGQYITESELLDLSQYTIETALVDLRQYYEDGTMVGGLLYIQGQMQNQAQNAKQTSQSVKNKQQAVTGVSQSSGSSQPNPVTPPQTPTPQSK